MISGKIEGSQSLDQLRQYIEKFKNPDLVPLALDIKQAIVEGNREGLIAGTNADGSRAADLEPSTIERGDRGGFGPPRVPRYAGSRLIDRFRVEVEPNATGGFRINAGWVGVPQVKYFRAGTRNMVARNPVGIRPATGKQIMDAVKAFARKLVVRG